MKLTFMFICASAVLISSCAMPGVNATGGTGTQSNVAFVVNGYSVTTEELMTTPGLREPLKQLMVLNGILSMAAAQQIEIDPAVIEVRVDERKQQAKEQGRDFYVILEEMDTTEADLRENYRVSLIWEALLESRLEYTEDDLQALWDSNPNRFINVYVRENSLTDSEKEALTYEDLEDEVYQAFKYDNFSAIATTLQQEILDRVDLNITCIADPNDRKYFEDLIINRKQSNYVSQLDRPDVGVGSNSVSEQENSADSQDEDSTDSSADPDGTQSDSSAAGPATGE